MQEYFSSSESKEEFESKLIDAGFNTEEKPFPHFALEDIFLAIQENKYKRKNIVESPHDYCFVLELYKPLKDFDEENPLFKFFKSLNEPCAHGICGREPKYGIQKYLKQ